MFSHLIIPPARYLSVFLGEKLIDVVLDNAEAASLARRSSQAAQTGSAAARSARQTRCAATLVARQESGTRRISCVHWCRHRASTSSSSQINLIPMPRKHQCVLFGVYYPCPWFQRSDTTSFERLQTYHCCQRWQNFTHAGLRYLSL